MLELHCQWWGLPGLLQGGLVLVLVLVLALLVLACARAQRDLNKHQHHQCDHIAAGLSARELILQAESLLLGCPMYASLNSSNFFRSKFLEFCGGTSNFHRSIVRRTS